MLCRSLVVTATALLSLAGVLQASEPLPPDTTVTHALSGASPGDGVHWDFVRGLFAETAEQAAVADWTQITVPSNWELEGQGTYSYGRGSDRKDADRKRELSDVGTYRHSFLVPDHLKAPREASLPQHRRFFLRFDGVMTDARVFLNGEHLLTTRGDEEHQGGFVPFSYDVTDRLKLNEENELIVAVREESTNASVNRAERDADYWLFGGIFRPVHLVSTPWKYIRSVAVDARADGTVRIDADVEPGAFYPDTERHAPEPVITAILRNTRNPRAIRILAKGSVPVNDAGLTRLELDVPSPRPWSTENPNLYSLELRLNFAHRLEIPIGFRTVEVRTAPRHRTIQAPSSTGLFVNGERLILRGINRHSFWPETGRALSAEQNRRDVELIKSLGFNAVRSSHYPPDQAFLDACDELGLYVIDELPGWHDAYDTNTAERIARAMLERDRNHPSILIWANGNEGGWNAAAEPVFDELDLQQRPVIRPDAVHGGFDARHYPNWEELESILDATSPRYRFLAPLKPAPLILFTEMLHGLYDGGGAAGLARYWQRLSESPRFAGGFLWALLDEGVVRVDQPKVAGADGALRHPIDTAGNFAADGIVGPFREPSASSRALRQGFQAFDGTSPDPATPIQMPKWINDVARPGSLSLERSGSPTRGSVTLVQFGSTQSVSPVPKRQIEVVLARGQREDSDPGDAGPGDSRGRGLGIVRFTSLGRAVPIEGGRWLTSGATTEARPRLVGELFEPGPSLPAEAVGVHQPWASDSAAELPADAIRYTQTFTSPDHAVRWTLSPTGLTVEVRATLLHDQNWAGLQFGLPHEAVSAFEWLGPGPDRIWRNRTTGHRDLWRATFASESNQPGQVESMTDGSLYYHLPVEGVYQSEGSLIRFRFDDGSPPLAIGIDAPWIGLFKPSFPDDAGLTAPALPPGLTLYARAPGMGTKFYEARELEPKLKARAVTLSATFRISASEPEAPSGGSDSTDTGQQRNH